MTLLTDGPRTSPRVPPHNAEAEESVLGAMMMSPDAAALSLEKLTMDDFYKPVHQAVFESILDVFDSNQPIDAITVADQLRKRKTLDRVGARGTARFFGAYCEGDRALRRALMAHAPRERLRIAAHSLRYPARRTPGESS